MNNANSLESTYRGYEIARKRMQRERNRRRRAAIANVRRIAVVGVTLLVICIAINANGDDAKAPADEPAIPSSQPPAEEALAQAEPPASTTPAPTAPEPVEEASHYILYDVPLSEELQRYTQDVCEEYGVDFLLVLAIMQKESIFQADVISATSDYGLMQINQGNHKWLEGALGITEWLGPEQNILAGVYVLSQLSHYDDPHQVLMSYNNGPTGAKNLWVAGVYSTAYSRAVVEILDGLEVMTIE